MMRCMCVEKGAHFDQIDVYVNAQETGWSTIVTYLETVGIGFDIDEFLEFASVFLAANHQDAIDVAE